MRRRDRSFRPCSARHRVALLASLVTSLACQSATPRVQVSEFPAGKHVSVAHGIELALVRAQYEPTGIALGFAVENRSATPLTIDRRGILLQVGELEFPLAAGSTIAEHVEVGAGERVALEAYFETGQRLGTTGTLHLRALRSGEQWLAQARIAVPSATAAAPPGLLE